LEKIKRYMRAKLVNEERFVRGKNPKQALNIGIANKIFQSCGKPYGEGGGYSFDYYGPDNWMDIIQWLLDQGYTPEETEEVMRSKLMRWTSDEAGKGDGDCTLEDFIKFNNHAGYKSRGKNQIEDFLDQYLLDPSRSERVKRQIDEDAMGGVSAPMGTLNNTPGTGSAQPPASVSMGSMGTASSGSGDKWDASIGSIHTQAPSKKVNEQNINPHDKLGVAMAKRMGIPLVFKKGKGDKDVEQVKVDEDIDLSTSLMTFDEWAEKFNKK